MAEIYINRARKSRWGHVYAIGKNEDGYLIAMLDKIYRPGGEIKKSWQIVTGKIKSFDEATLRLDEFLKVMASTPEDELQRGTFRKK